MAELSRRDAMRAAVGLTAVGLGPASASAQEEAPKVSPLDAVFRVAVVPMRTDGNYWVIELRFETPGVAEQKFESAEYRYALLDKSGVQVGPAVADNVFVHTAAVGHTTFLEKGKRTVSDYSDYWLNHRGLKPGGEHYLVVSVRNLTALAILKSA